MKIRVLKQAFLASVAMAFAATSSLAATATDPVLAEVTTGEWRSADEKSRDAARKPIENLQFWGLKPGASILEVQPGAGWWTRILAPYAARTGGRYSATAADLANPSITEAARKGRADFAARFADDKIYGKVELVNWGATAAPLPTNSYDFILLSRVIHGWMRVDGLVDRNFASLAGSLKPGGVLLMLVKPQFELQPENIGKNGLVKDPAMYPVIEKRIRTSLSELGLKVTGWYDSAIDGGDGNREFFVQATKPLED